MMNLVKWNPLRDVAALQNRINRLFEEPFWSPTAADDELSLGSWYPAVDMYEHDDKFVIQAELPGLDKKDVSVDVKDRVLTLKGERSSENEVKEKNYYRRERAFGKFQRAFTLPVEVDAEKIKADFKDGLLKIEIPKPEGQKPRRITIH